jgi:hypothetical protein
MNIIEERICSLPLTGSECLPLGKAELDGLRATSKRLAAGEFAGFVEKTFSIGALSLESASAKLKSLDIRDQIVCAYWPGFQEGIAIKWQLFADYFGALWHPGSDDIIVTSQGASWLLEITHEETIRFFRATALAGHSL